MPLLIIRGRLIKKKYNLVATLKEIDFNIEIRNRIMISYRI
jgi:hypothetical protein